MDSEGEGLRYGDRAWGCGGCRGCGGCGGCGSCGRVGEKEGWGGMEEDGVVFLQVSHSSREELLLFSSTHSTLHFIKLNSATKVQIKTSGCISSAS